MAQVQHVTPHLRQTLLQRSAWGHVLLTVEFNIGRRQGAPVKLAVGGQRHAGQQHQMGRHHVVGQLGFEVTLEVIAQGGLRLFVVLRHAAHQVRGQLLATGHVQRQHHCFAHRRVIEQAVFDFAQLDTKTANFHLMVDASDIFDQPVNTLAHQIAGAVQAPAVAGKRVGDKTFGGQTGTLVITLSQTGATDVQLTDSPLRHQRQAGIQDIRDPGTNDLTDGHTGGAIFHLCRGQTGQRHDHGFGRPVGVEKHLGAERGANALQMLPGERFTAGDAHAHGQGLLATGQPLRQLAAIAGRKAQNADLLLVDQLADLLGIPLPLGTQHHPRAAQ